MALFGQCWYHPQHPAWVVYSTGVCGTQLAGQGLEYGQPPMPCHMQLRRALGFHYIQVENIDCEINNIGNTCTVLLAQYCGALMGLQAPYRCDMLQDADKSRAVEEEEAAKELQTSLAAKYGATLEPLQV